MACARPSAHLSLLRPSWFSRELARFIRLRAAAGDGHDNSDASALVPATRYLAVLVRDGPSTIDLCGRWKSAKSES